ncbi:MAG TPA: flagellar export chaperone FlgN, partial [Candidatus Kryptobacter bacterium]|nr:flagellar export chaperone FlgN [Candidatus Kryptobacter bacterium]
RKQAAIGKLDTEEIQKIVGEELDELNNIRLAEEKRAAILKRLALSGSDVNDPRMLSAKLGRENSENYLKLHTGFRKVYEQVVQLNNITNVILLHSIAFIRQNIRILTDNGNRKLVDKKA